jgi:tetratricopeptide (TPR) repeat protein
MKALKVIIFSLIIMGAYSCGDNFLEVNPQGALDGSALQSPAGIEASLISAYSMLDGWNGQWGNNGPWAKDAGHWIWSNVASDDAHKGSEASDIPQILEIEKFQWLPSNNLLEDLFLPRYEGIARVNATISLNASSTEIDAGRKAEIEAEARFLRAHYHFDIWRAFKNIPYYTEADEDYRKPNTEDIIPNIVADLEAAIAVLPTDQAEVGRVTKGAAQAYLGKVYMHNGQYAEAKAQFDAVVASNKYSLAPCFHDNFNADKDNGSESVFAVQFSVNDGDPGANNGNYGTRLGFPHSGSPFGCCGFNQPTPDLVNAFKTDGSGLPVRDGADIDFTNDNIDPRLDWTVGRDGVPFYNHGNHERSWIRDPSHGGIYSPKKTQFHADQDQYNSGASAGAWGPQVSAINYNIIRYADVLLMLAEAEVELGNLEAARALVNQVRNRANGCAQGPGTSASDIEVATNDAGITWANYNVGEYTSAWSDAGAARDAVRLERRLELAMEGHRFYDLRRWGILESTMNAYIAANNSRTDGDELKRQHLVDANNVEAKHYAFPLPQVQIDLSEVDGTPRLTQNPGF